MGSLINGALVILGGAIGLLIKKGLKDDMKEILIDVLGVILLIVGIVGIVPAMLKISDGKLVEQGMLLLILSLIIGTFIGQLIDIDKYLNKFGMFIEHKINKPGFSKGFITGSIFFCVGAMAIVGSITEGLTGDYSILISKGLIDFVTAIIFGSTLGFGVMFSAIPIIIYQGSLTLLASVLEPYISAELTNDICMVGYAIIFCIGINFLDIKKIKTANMIPALIVPIIWYMIASLF